MTRLLSVVAISTAVALAAIAVPTTADARCRGCGVAASVIGFAAGAAIGAATAPRYYGPDYAYYGPGYGYPTYYGAYDSYGYGYPYRYGGSTADYTNMDRQLQGTR